VFSLFCDFWHFFLIIISGREKWTWTDGRATGMNHVHKIGRQLNLGIQPQEIADGFGRHSVDVMEKSYLLPEKSTRAISAYNLIREMGDTMGFDEKNKISNFRQQKKILANVRNNPSLKRKRSSLEILNDSNLANSPPKSTTARTISLSQIPQECSPSMQLTQNVTNIQNIGTIASGNKNNMKFEILKKLMQQQQQNAEDERIARERFEDRQRKNQQQFNEMLLKYL
jgi:hypothetical protein